MLSVPAVASWVENREKVVALYALGEQKKNWLWKIVCCVVSFRYFCRLEAGASVCSKLGFINLELRKLFGEKMARFSMQFDGGFCAGVFAKNPEEIY